MLKISSNLVFKQLSTQPFPFHNSVESWLDEESWVHSTLPFGFGHDELMPEFWRTTEWFPPYAVLQRGTWAKSIYRDVLDPMPTVTAEITHMDFKKSEGSEPYSQNMKSRMRRAVLTTGIVSQKKPKKPVFYPLTFYGREPTLVPFDKAKMPLPKRYPGVSDEVWAKKLALLTWRRDIRWARINNNRETRFAMRKRNYDVRRADFERRQREHLEIFRIRLQVWERRMAVWNRSVERAANRTLRLLPMQKFTEDHPFLHFALNSDNGVAHPLYYAWNPTPSDMAVVRQAVAPFTPGYMSRFDDSAFRERSLEAIGRTILLLAEPTLLKEEGQLVRKLYDKIADQKVHIGNLLAERAQTFEMLLVNYQRLADLVNLKKGLFRRVRDFMKHPKDWADEVLAWKFGAEPLINDITAALRLLNETDELALPEVRSQSRTIKFIDNDSGRMSFCGFMSVSYTVRLSCSNDVARSATQLGLFDSSQIAWEVTPWSFVVDWLIPVGSYLASGSSLVGMDLESCIRAVKLVGDFSINSFPGAPSGFMKDVAARGEDLALVQGDFSGFVKGRDFVPLPSRDRVLVLKSPWSMSHGVEAVALAVQRLKSLR